MTNINNSLGFRGGTKNVLMMFENKGAKAFKEALIKNACSARQEIGNVAATASHETAWEMFTKALKEKKPFDAVILRGKNDGGPNRPSDGLDLLQKISKFLSPKKILMITDNPVLTSPVQAKGAKCIKPNGSFEHMLEAVSKTIYA